MIDFKSKFLGEEITEKEWSDEKNAFRREFYDTFNELAYKKTLPLLEKLFANMGAPNADKEPAYFSPLTLKVIPAPMDGIDKIVFDALEKFNICRFSKSGRGSIGLRMSNYARGVCWRDGKKTSLVDFLSSRFDGRYIAKCIAKKLFSVAANTGGTIESDIEPFEHFVYISYQDESNHSNKLCPLDPNFVGVKPRDGFHALDFSKETVARVVEKLSRIPDEHVEFISYIFGRRQGSRDVWNASFPERDLDTPIGFAHALAPTTMSRYVIGMTYDHRWIASQSTRQGWTSCMNLADGCNRHYVGSGASLGSFVAYLFDRNSLNADDKRPSGRIMFKPYFDDSVGKTVDEVAKAKIRFENVVWVADATYGTVPDWFKRAAREIVDKAQGMDKKFGKFELPKDIYADNIRGDLKLGGNGLMLAVRMLEKRPKTVAKFSKGQLALMLSERPEVLNDENVLREVMKSPYAVTAIADAAASSGLPRAVGEFFNGIGVEGSLKILMPKAHTAAIDTLRDALSFGKIIGGLDVDFSRQLVAGALTIVFENESVKKHHKLIDTIVETLMNGVRPPERGRILEMVGEKDEDLAARWFVAFGDESQNVPKAFAARIIKSGAIDRAIEEFMKTGAESPANAEADAFPRVVALHKAASGIAEKPAAVFVRMIVEYAYRNSWGANIINEALVALKDCGGAIEDVIDVAQSRRKLPRGAFGEKPSDKFAGLVEMYEKLEAILKTRMAGDDDEASKAAVTGYSRILASSLWNKRRNVDDFKAYVRGEFAGVCAELLKLGRRAQLVELIYWSEITTVNFRSGSDNASAFAMLVSAIAEAGYWKEIVDFVGFFVSVNEYGSVDGKITRKAFDEFLVKTAAKYGEFFPWPVYAYAIAGTTQFETDYKPFKRYKNTLWGAYPYFVTCVEGQDSTFRYHIDESMLSQAEVAKIISGDWWPIGIRLPNTGEWPARTRNRLKDFAELVKANLFNLPAYLDDNIVESAEEAKNVAGAIKRVGDVKIPRDSLEEIFESMYAWAQKANANYARSFEKWV